MSYCVYKHTFPNGKVYIGITSMNPCRRWANGIGYKKQSLMFNAINKYGWDNIKHEILFAELNKTDAEEKEIELIKLYKSNDNEYGYNVSNGGNSTGMMSEETKNRISKTLKGRPKEHPPFKGKKHKIESRLKLSDKRKGNMNPMFGKHLSEESKKKMSDAHKNGKLCKAVVCLETGQVFKSASETARQMNLQQTLISKVARGEQEHTKGYHFKYLTREALNGKV